MVQAKKILCTTLHGVYCKDSALKKLINLRSLGLWGIGKHPNLEECLGAMECLRALDLAAEGGVDLSLFKLLTMLGLRNLQHLKLNCKLRTTEKDNSEPSHSYLLRSLTKLELYNSGSEQKHINLIAEVPNLADLILGEGSYAEKDMVIPAKGFQELKRLHINKLSKLEAISVAEDVGSALEKLREISILKCEALTTIPHHLTTLKDLVLLAVNNCPNIDNLPQKSSGQIRENSIIFRQ